MKPVSRTRLAELSLSLSSFYKMCNFTAFLQDTKVTKTNPVNNVVIQYVGLLYIAKAQGTC